MLMSLEAAPQIFLRPAIEDSVLELQLLTALQGRQFDVLEDDGS